MYIEIMINYAKYIKKWLCLVSRRYSHYQTVLLSYSDISRCSLLIKTFLLCLIQATYYNRSTHMYMTATKRRNK